MGSAKLEKVYCLRKKDRHAAGDLLLYEHKLRYFASKLKGYPPEPEYPVELSEAEVEEMFAQIYKLFVIGINKRVN